MADINTYVPEAQGYDPLGAYSKLLNAQGAMLGLQQQRQQLQTGQIEQQRQQAALAPEQQKAKEVQALSDVDWSDPKYTNEDGSMTSAGRKLATQIAPMSGSDFATAHSTAGQAIFNLNKAKGDLTQDQVKGLQQDTAGWMNTPNSKPSDLQAMWEQRLEATPDSQKASMKTAMDSVHTLLTTGVPTDPQGNPSAQGMKARGQMMARAAAQNGGLQSGSLDVGNVNVPTATDLVTGARTGQPGVAAYGLGPTQTPRYQASIGGASGDVQAYQTANNAAQAAPRITALANALDNTMAKGYSSLAANNPEYAKLVRQYVPDADKLSNTAVAGKLAAQLQLLRGSAAPNTDAARQTIHDSGPDVGLGAKAVKAANDFIRQQAQYDTERLQHLQRQGISNDNPLGAADQVTRFTGSRPAPPLEAAKSQAAAPSGGGGYKSAADVKSAYQSGKITRDQAKAALKQYGMQ